MGVNSTKEKKENTLALLLCSSIMLLKICTIFVLFALHHDNHALHHKVPAPLVEKDKIAWNPK